MSLAQRDHKAKPVPLAHRVRLVHLDLEAPQDYPVLRARRVLLALLELKGPQVLRDQQESRDHKEAPERRDLRVVQGLLVLRA